jgi:hypothetical protein
VFDVLNVTGTALFTGGAFSITTLNGFTPSIGQFFDVVTTTGGISGTQTVSIPTGYTFTQSGNNGRLTFVGAAVVVPEASTFALALPALVMVGTIVIKRRKK